MFSQSPYLSFGLFPQFCTYMIFWPVIVKYSNTNLHMHIEPPKNILYNVLLLTHLSTLDFYLSSSCAPICVIFRWLTYKCSDCSHIINALSFFSIADSYTHAQRYQNAMKIIVAMKSYFHEQKYLYLSYISSFRPIVDV